MPALSNSLFLLTLAVSAAALATPHGSRSLHNHHALAARVAVPAPAVPIVAVHQEPVVRPVSKRGLSKRCRARSSSAVPASSSVAPAPASTSSPVSAQPTVPVANPESAPPPPPASEPKPSSAAPKPPPPPPTTSSPPPQTTQASPTTTAAPQSGNTPSFLIGTQSGDGTFYGIGLGACGVTNSGDDKIVAVSELLFDTFPGYNGVNPNTNPVCGRKIIATYQGKSTTVTVEDRCTACSITSLDFSPAAFDEIADPAIGRLHEVSWVWA